MERSVIHMNTYHNKTIDETVKETGGNIHNGLSSKEAARRLRQNGPNALPEKKSKPFIVRFFSQFGDFMTVILLIAAGVSFALSLIDGRRRYIRADYNSGNSLL